MIKNYRNRGIILVLKQLKEADRMAILWTEDRGKKAYIVKGANKLLSRKAACLDQLNLINFGAYRSRSEYDLLTEAELVNDFHFLKATEEGISLSFYFLEVLDRFLTDEQSNYELFQWFCEFLNYLNKNTGDMQKFLLLFQFKVLTAFGFSPLIDSCSYCFRKLQPNEARVLNKDGEPGFICSLHFDSISTRNSLISDTIIKILKFLANADLESIAKLNLTEEQSAQIFAIQNEWLETVSEKKFLSQNLLFIWKKHKK